MNIIGKLKPFWLQNILKYDPSIYWCWGSNLNKQHPLYKKFIKI